MSQQFYDKILSMVLGFLVIMVLTIASTEFLTVYILKGNLNYYYGYLVTIGAATILGVIYFDKFRRIRHDLEFLIPNIQIKDERFEPIDVKDQDLSVQVCQAYYNGASFESIKDNLSLKHPEQARRLLKQGLAILLKFYGEHQERKEKP